MVDKMMMMVCSKCGRDIPDGEVHYITVNLDGEWWLQLFNNDNTVCQECHAKG